MSMTEVKTEIAPLPVLTPDLDLAYRQMAQEEQREQEAWEWAEATLQDVADEPIRSETAQG